MLVFDKPVIIWFQVPEMLSKRAVLKNMAKCCGGILIIKYYTTPAKLRGFEVQMNISKY